MTSPGPSHLQSALEQILDLFRAGRVEEAGAAAAALVEEAPTFGPAWDRLARAHGRLGRPDEAIACYRRTVELMPDHAEAHNNLAVLLQQRGDPQGAQAHYQQAIALGMRHPLLFSNYGCLLRDAGHLEAGVDCFQNALALDPSAGHALANLGATLALQSRIEEALAHLRVAVALQPDWHFVHSNLLFCLNYSDAVSRAAVMAQHRRFGRRYAEAWRERRPSFPNSPDPDRRLRIGLVSPDFRQHSVAYFVEPLLGALDRSRVEVFCYADVPKPDAVTARLRPHADHWRDIAGAVDDDVEVLLRRDQIDVVLDLAGHTNGNRLALLSRRVAPVQVSYLGYCNTTGLETMDYRITDRFADPPGMTEWLHSEELLRMPGGFLCYAPRQPAPPIASPPSATTGRITFGSFNSLAKVSPTVVALWARILDRVPGSRLYIKGPALTDQPTLERFRQRLSGTALAGRDVELSTRIQEERDHLRAYDRIDVALDTWPYCGTTTTCEALWMGVPVVTLATDAHASRVGASILSVVGLPDLVASSPDGYVDAAVALGGDAPRLAELRDSLRSRVARSPLVDATRAARQLEQALRDAWRRWCERVQTRATSAPPAGTAFVALPGELDVALPSPPPSDAAPDDGALGFLRSVLCAGDRVLDLGAGYGVASVVAGRAVGRTGRVWAVEPAPAKAAALRASARANGLRNLEIVEAAVDEAEGRGAPTLDGEAEARGISAPALLRLARPLAEDRALARLSGLIASGSPLIWLEASGDARARTAALERLRGLGYGAFRLLPGLGLLTPLEEGTDAPLIDIFACKPDRAAALAERELAALRVEAAPPAEARGWLTLFGRLAFAEPFAGRWAAETTVPAAYLTGLDHYAMAQRTDQAPGVRVAHLRQALAEVEQTPLATSPDAVAWAQTLARLAWDLGQPEDALRALRTANGARGTGAHLDANDIAPFVPASPQFDAVRPGADVAAFLEASAQDLQSRIVRQRP